MFPNKFFCSRRDRTTYPRNCRSRPSIHRLWRLRCDFGFQNDIPTSWHSCSPRIETSPHGGGGARANWRIAPKKLENSIAITLLWEVCLMVCISDWNYHVPLADVRLYLFFLLPSVFLLPAVSSLSILEDQLHLSCLLRFNDEWRIADICYWGSIFTPFGVLYVLIVVEHRVGYSNRARVCIHTEDRKS